MVVVVLFAVFLTWARVGVQNYFMQYAKNHGVKETRKFAESSWKGIFYVISWSCGLYLALSHDLFPNVRNCWAEFGSPMSMDMKIFYLAELGFYVHSLYAHVTMEIKRSDYWALFSHHVVTIGLIYFSYAIAAHNIGLLILVIHDTSDVLFEGGKTFLYREKHLITNVLFVCFILSWFVTRLTIFPFYLIHSAYYHPPQDLPDILKPYPLNALHPPFVWALLFLQALHVYWFLLILRTAWRKISKAELADPREDKED